MRCGAQTANFLGLSQSADPEARCRQRVVQESHARASWRLLIDKQSRQAVPPRAAPAHGGQRSLEELVRGETGVCGPFCGFGFLARAVLYQLTPALLGPFFPCLAAGGAPWRGEREREPRHMGLGWRARGRRARETRAGSRLLISLDRTTCIRSGPNRSVAAQKKAISPEPRTATLTRANAVSRH